MMEKDHQDKIMADIETKKLNMMVKDLQDKTAEEISEETIKEVMVKEAETEEEGIIEGAQNLMKIKRIEQLLFRFEIILLKSIYLQVNLL
jgi:hypothetical protein